MFVSWDVSKLKIEQEYSGDPPVDGGVGLNVGVAEHALDVTCIDLDN